jgi:hypothetical protein
MPLDRSPGGYLDEILKAAVRRSRGAAAEAHRLLEAGFPGPAYVWAVRSIEVFVKEVMLLPLVLEEIDLGADDHWEQAWKRVRELFGNGRWDLALRKVEEAYGNLDPMETDDGKDVWSVWKSRVVSRRGEIVHGFPSGAGDPSLPEAESDWVPWRLHTLEEDGAWQRAEQPQRSTRLS